MLFYENKVTPALLRFKSALLCIRGLRVCIDLQKEGSNGHRAKRSPVDPSTREPCGGRGATRRVTNRKEKNGIFSSACITHNKRGEIPLAAYKTRYKGFDEGPLDGWITFFETVDRQPVTASFFTRKIPGVRIEISARFN